VRSQKALRYAPERKDWLAWDGKRSRPNCDGEAMRQAVKSATSIFADAAEIDDKKRRDAVLAHAKASERRERLNAAIEIGKTDLRLVVHLEHLDADPFLLNVENGSLDLRTGELREHNPDDLISNIAPVVWVPGAQDDVLARGPARGAASGRTRGRGAGV
jgi:putative DNA primase/helicase